MAQYIAHFTVAIALLFAQISKSVGLRCYSCISQEWNNFHPEKLPVNAQCGRNPGKGLLKSVPAAPYNGTAPFCVKVATTDSDGDYRVGRHFEYLDDEIKEEWEISDGGYIQVPLAAGNMTVCVCNADECNDGESTAYSKILFFTCILAAVCRSFCHVLL